MADSGSSTSPWPTVIVVLGVLSFIPGFGLFIGPMTIVLGLVLAPGKNHKTGTGRGRLKTGIILACTGVLLNIAVYGALFYFGFVAKTGPFVKIKKVNTSLTLAQLMGFLEVYKKEHGQYPADLRDIAREGNFVHTRDMFNNVVMYRLSDDGSTYDLFSPGPDGIADTGDDIRAGDYKMEDMKDFSWSKWRQYQ